MKVFLLIASLLVLVVGCQTAAPSPPQSTVKAPELPTPPPVVTQNETPSALSYGTATQVKKGVTTQMEIMDKFGGPDIMTTDKDGIEVWMYDKTTSSVTSSSAQSGSQATQSEASVMAGYLGVPFIAGVAGAKSTAGGQSAQVSQGTGKVERTAKTITFIIKFNPDKTVKDYAVRQSKY